MTSVSSFVMMALAIGIAMARRTAARSSLFTSPSRSSSTTTTTRHPLEDKKSWSLHLARSSPQGQQQQQQQQRRLQAVLVPPPRGDAGNQQDTAAPAPATPGATPDDADNTSNNNNNEDPPVPYVIKHKKPKKHIPFAGGDTTHGMMIDAGSQGTRLHIYEWDKRILLDEDDLLDVSHGLKLSIPTSNSRWTDKYTPGLDALAFHKKPAKLDKALRTYLGPLLEFAKTVLKDKEDQWHTYPIYLKATGGLRTLPKKDRVRLIEAVRTLFNDHDTFNPFAFEDEQARVISGEEEAIYGWVGVNFAKGTLIESSFGNGVASLRKHRQLTFGMLEMGGASTQIAVYENNGDLMANLFKLQLGGARHWNVYVHSYLYFGVNGAWTRLNGHLHGEGTNVNPCLPLGAETDFSSFATLDPEGRFYARSAPESQVYSVKMINNGTTFDYAACSQRTYNLLRNDANQEWCQFEMDGNCGFAGIYQPPLPQVNRDIDEFVASSNFVDVYQFLQIGERAAVSKIGEAAEQVCSLNWEEMKEYNNNLSDSPIKEGDEHSLAQMCFRSVFVYQLLRNGWKFGDDYEMTAVDVINGQKMGWALGCMLYEINTLPWDFRPELLYRGPSWWLISLYIILGTLGGSAVGFTIAMRTSKKFNKRVRESVFFRKSGVFNNPTVRKSLALPPMEDLQSLFDAESEDKEVDEKEALVKSSDEGNGTNGTNGTRYT